MECKQNMPLLSRKTKLKLELAPQLGNLLNSIATEGIARLMDCILNYDLITIKLFAEVVQ